MCGYAVVVAFALIGGFWPMAQFLNFLPEDDRNPPPMPSTVILKSSYNAETSTLTITFVSGLVYDYKNVPEETYKAMISSGAKGIYFNQHIKGKYEWEKVGRQ